MKRYSDKGDYYIGYKFGKLTVLTEVFVDKNKQGKFESFVICECECGNRNYRCQISRLVSGCIDSCGCLKFRLLSAFGETKNIADWSRDSRCVVNYSTLLLRLTKNNKKIKWTPEQAITTPISSKPKAINLEGKRFNKLLVIRKIKNLGNNKNYWECQCDCGNTTCTRGGRLVNGETTSCGCYGKERLRDGREARIKDQFGRASKMNVLYSYKHNAKKRGFEWQLTDEEFFELTKQNCYYCNTKPFQIKKNIHGNGDYIYNGVDRLDSKKSYFIQNCVSCCGVCNIMKMDLTKEEFLNKIVSIYNNLICEKR